MCIFLQDTHFTNLSARSGDMNAISVIIIVNLEE
jgi:hypothetical protein